MSDADYDKVEDSYRNFKKRKLKENPNWKEYAGQVDIDYGKEEADKIEIGARCECIGGARGEVMFKGDKLRGLERGFWIGVKLDEPTGDNDGKL